MKTFDVAPVELVNEAYAAALRQYRGRWSVRIAKLLTVLGAAAFAVSGKLVALPHLPIALALWGFGLGELGAIFFVPGASYWLIRRLGVTRRRIAARLGTDLVRGETAPVQSVGCEPGVPHVAAGRSGVLG